MKRRWTVAAALACAMASIAPGFLVGARAEDVDTTEVDDGVHRLQTSGGHFVDKHGRVVILHGFNLVDKGPKSTAYPDDATDGDGFTEADAQFLADNGFNAIRLGINWSQLVPERPAVPGEFEVDQGYLDKVVRVARLLAKYKIWYFLDAHQDCFGGWPAWAIPWDKAIQQPRLGFPVCTLAPNAVTRAWDNLLKNPDPDNALLPGGSAAVIPVQEVWTTFREMWRQVAERFRPEDYLLGYDFINEPAAGSTVATCFNVVTGCQQPEEKLQDFLLNALAGIREADPVDSAAQVRRAGIAMFEPNQLNGTGGEPTGLGNVPVTDPKVAFTFHIYCGGTEFGEQDLGCEPLTEGAWSGNAGIGGAPANAAHLTGADRDATGAQRRPGAEPAPMLLGEFGSTKNADVIRYAVEDAEKYFASWTYWEYQDGNGGQDSLFENAAQEQCTCFDGQPTPRADVLIRPYPRATAGRPTSFAIDAATKVMTYAYDAASATGPKTEIFVPKHWAPNGYDVAVSGGKAQSEPGAMALSIKADGSGPVTVVVTARA